MLLINKLIIITDYKANIKQRLIIELFHTETQRVFLMLQPIKFMSQFESCVSFTQSSKSIKLEFY